MVTPKWLRLERQQGVKLIQGMARAFRWRRMIEAGYFNTINERAAAEKIDPSYVSRLRRLTLRAQEVIDGRLDSRQPEAMTLPGLMKVIPVG